MMPKKKEELFNQLFSQFLNLLMGHSDSNQSWVSILHEALSGVSLSTARYFIEIFSARALNVYQYGKLPNEVGKTLFIIRNILWDNKDDIYYLSSLFKSNPNGMMPLDRVCLESTMALNRNIIRALKPLPDHFLKILLSAKEARKGENVRTCVSPEFRKRIKVFIRILNQHEPLLIKLSKRKENFDTLSCVLRHSCDGAQRAIIILEKYKKTLRGLMKKGLTLKNLSNLFNSSYTGIDLAFKSLFENVDTFDDLKKKADLTYPQLCSLLSGSKNKIKDSMDCFMENIDGFNLIMKIDERNNSTIFFSLSRSGHLIGNNIVKLLKSILILDELGLSAEQIKHSFSRAGRNNRLKDRLQWVVNHREELEKKRQLGESPAAISKYIFDMTVTKEEDVPSCHGKRVLEGDATENNHVASVASYDALLAGNYHFFSKQHDGPYQCVVYSTTR
jgi:hypothetical protein